MKVYEQIYRSKVIDPLNGYYHGKRWFNVTLAAWREDIANGLLTKAELIDDYGEAIINRLK